MERIEYRDVVDRSEWAPGPWEGEPDKIQWRDEATGLPCLIVRGRVGSLCGYVGVAPGHPLYRVDYSTCPQGCKQEWCDHRPESALKVHGGVTFTDSCDDLSREAWIEFRERLLARHKEARQYPRGDAARYLREWADGLKDYQAWVERKHARAICHIPAVGEPDCIWWFGFDCAHAGDISPGLDSDRQFGKLADMTYRDIAYVTAECQDLAKQLYQLSAAGSQST